jgi:hypothetical protein
MAGRAAWEAQGELKLCPEKQSFLKKGLAIDLVL